MKAVIFAGGSGTRLKPLTNTRPKVMLQVAGKPILYYILKIVKEAGINDAIIVVREMKEQIINYFSTPAVQKQLGIKLEFVDQGKDYGTAKALLAAESKINSTFVALAADLTEPGALKAVIKAHNPKKSESTMCLTKVKEPKRYGVIELDKENKVVGLEEKPEKPKSDLVNISVYCFEPTIFAKLKKIKPSIRGEYEITECLLGSIGTIYSGYWLDIAYPWDLFDANEYLLSQMDGVENGEIENSTIKGKIIMEKGAKLINSHVEGFSYISEGCEISNANLRGINSFGKNCHIGGFTNIKNSILFDNVNARHLTYIGDSIVGEGVNFGSGTQTANLRFDGESINVETEKGWVNTKKKKLGAIIGDNVKFGVNACIMPGKTIGENCWIGTVVINKNIKPNTHVYLKQELNEYVEKKR